MGTFKFNNGVEMPALIQATNWMNYKQLKPLVLEGLKRGIRAFDTARDYANEHIVGGVLNDCLRQTGIKREDIFITTKIGNSQQSKGDVINEIDISLRNLKTDYIDLWLMHWPYQNYYPDTWQQMQEVYRTGKVRAIGVANFEIRHLETIMSDMPPHCVQFEHHPLRTSEDLIRFLTNNDIAVQSYSPLCRMIRPVRESLVLQNIAKIKNKTIAQIILRWHYQLNTASVFKTTNENRLKENTDIWDFTLSHDEMLQISSLNEDYKYHLESVSCPGY